MKAGAHYEFQNGNKFKVELIKNGLCHCRVVGRYETFYLTVLEGNQKLFDSEIKEVPESQ